MNALLSFQRRALLLGFCVCLVAGCRSSANVPMAPVRGKVLVDGQLVTSGQVTLLPVAATGGTKSAGLSAGEIKSDGTYTIHTGGKEGAPLGTYKVTVTPSMVPVAGATGPPVAPYNQKFRDASQTDLQIEVVTDAPAGKYDLTLSK